MSVAPQALFRRVTLVPNKSVKGRQLCRPFGSEGVHAPDHNAISIVIEHRPWIGLIPRVHPFAECRGA